MKLQERDPLPQTVHRRFRIQGQSHFGKPGGDPAAAFLQICFVWMNQNNIVGISAITLNFHLFLDLVVKVGKITDGQKLADLASEADPAVAAETPDYVAYHVGELRIANFAPDHCTKSVMRDRIEKLSNIKAQNIAVGPVPPVIPEQQNLHPIKGECRSLVALASAIVINVAPRQIGIQAVLTHGALNHAIPKMQTANDPRFRADDMENNIFAQMIFAGRKFAFQFPA